MKALLYLALLVGTINGFFWRKLPQGSYFILDSFFVLLLCLFIYSKDKDSFIKFALVSLAAWDLFDELRDANTTTGFYELLTALTLPAFWIIIKKKNEANSTRR